MRHTAQTRAARLGRLVHDLGASLLYLERRFEPFFRPALNAALREPAARIIQALIHRRRRDEGLGLAAEAILPGEEAAVEAIIANMGAHMRRHYRPGGFERAGNTKTHGVVRGEVTVRSDLPDHMRKGIFAEPRRYPAWVRFAGPGPHSPADIDDIGFLSCSVKLMGVEGPKLLEEEKWTQDLLAISTPTFVTPDVVANVDLQSELGRGTPAFYFFRPGRSHVLDFLMQSLWNETQTSPLEATYWSAVPYLLGEGQAMQYAVRPTDRTRSAIPGIPMRTPEHYLREAMVRTLSRQEVTFEIAVQVQTDPHRMPIEDASVRWPERLSPFVPAATLRIPRQRFDSPAQLAFAKHLRFNPWHAVPEHRPLGSLGRARRRIYQELARLRQTENGVRHVEPTGHERFDA